MNNTYISNIFFKKGEKNPPQFFLFIAYKSVGLFQGFYCIVKFLIPTAFVENKCSMLVLGYSS